MKSKILKTSLLNLIKALRKWFIKNFYYICVTIYVLCNMAVSFIEPLIKRVVIMFMLGIIFLTIMVVKNEYEKEKLKLKNNIPVLGKRFTDFDGERVIVNKDDVSEMVLYIYSIENYLEKLGFYI